ncbi:MAG: CocE/NonD family hydrolase, partial [Chloroflexi bacterium]|nr:CocE/NonD family hydrolase [Chloroflexota bacterium]
STGDVDFGPNVVIDLQAEQARWFNSLLKSEDDGIAKEPRVKVFVMGANRWRESDDWPIPGTEYTPYYLHSGGKANSLTGDGGLNTAKPKSEKADHYAYDPMHPVPTAGGSTCCLEDSNPVSMGPRDQRPIEYRNDVLCYTSEPLKQAVEVTGPVKAVLYASSSARDTDWVVKLVDVAPNGFAMNAAQGILRARFRDSYEKPELMKPGEVYKFEIDLWSTSNSFQPGHRIRVDVTSSCFPQFDRNLNTGEDCGTGTKMAVAEQTILHDSEHPSHIVLPVIPAGK